MTKIFLALFLTSLSLLANQTETFSQKFENYLELEFQNFPGTSFYDSEGNLNISDLRDTTFFQDPNSSIPSEISTLYDRDYFDLNLHFQYFILKKLNLSGRIGLRNDRFTKNEKWTRFIDTLNDSREIERRFDDKKQSLILPLDINTEYFFTSKKFISSAIIGASIPLGNFNPFADSTLNSNGIGNLNIGFKAGYLSKTSFFEINAKYLSNFSSVSDQLNIGAAIDLFNVENVDLFGRLNYLINLNDVPNDSFNPALPNSDFSRLVLNAGASIKYHDFRFKLNYLLTLQATNQYDYRSIGFSVAYRFNKTNPDDKMTNKKKS